MIAARRPHVHGAPGKRFRRSKLGHTGAGQHDLGDRLLVGDGDKIVLLQPLFAVAKMAPGSQRQGDYLVVNGPRKIAQGRSIGEVLAALERQLRLIYSN